MITRQVREIKAKEDDVRVAKKKLDNFERFAASSAGSAAPNPLQRQVQARFEQDLF